MLKNILHTKGRLPEMSYFQGIKPKRSKLFPHIYLLCPLPQIPYFTIPDPGPNSLCAPKGVVPPGETL